MHRLIVVILAAVDAAIAAAVGIAATLAPLTLLWVLGMGGTADWGALWPAGTAVWQLGNLVPLHVTLPGDYLAVAGIDPGSASFVLSLAPLAFAAFTAIFAARSGVRASRADAWLTGVVTGSAVFAALATAIALTSANQLAEVELWQAILLPALVFALPLLAGAVVTEWREAGSGRIARVRDRIEAAPRGWGETPGLIVRGAAVVLAGLLGLGALVFAVALLVRGGEVIALFEAASVDALGATVVTLAQLAYLPTLAVWGLAFVAGPGFAVGTGTAVSPAGTQLGVIPGIPVLGALPESTTPWLLLLALLPIGLGALAGWIARSHLATPPVAPTTPQPSYVPTEWDAAPEAARSSALTALLAGVDAARPAGPADAAEEGRLDADRVGASDPDDPIGARFVLAVGIAALSAAGAALLALLASGSMGPGRLAEVGPQPGPVALAVGLEVLIGAAILLLSPRRRSKVAATADRRDAAAPLIDADATDTAPIELPAGGAAESAPPVPTDGSEPVPADGSEPVPWPRNADVVEPAPWPRTADVVEPADEPPSRRPARRPSRPSVPADPDSTPTVDLGPGRPNPLPPVD